MILSRLSLRAWHTPPPCHRRRTLRTDIPVLKGYRFIQCKNYLVFYRMEGKEIVVIRILYARRDYLGLLEPNKGSTDNGRTNP